VNDKKSIEPPENGDPTSQDGGTEGKPQNVKLAEAFHDLFTRVNGIDQSLDRIVAQLKNQQNLALNSLIDIHDALFQTWSLNDELSQESILLLDDFMNVVEGKLDLQHVVVRQPKENETVDTTLIKAIKNVPPTTNCRSKTIARVLKCAYLASGGGEMKILRKAEVIQYLDVSSQKAGEFHDDPDEENQLDLAGHEGEGADDEAPVDEQAGESGGGEKRKTLIDRVFVGVGFLGLFVFVLMFLWLNQKNDDLRQLEQLYNLNQMLHNEKYLEVAEGISSAGEWSDQKLKVAAMKETIKGEIKRLGDVGEKEKAAALLKALEPEDDALVAAREAAEKVLEDAKKGQVATKATQVKAVKALTKANEELKKSEDAFKTAEDALTVATDAVEEAASKKKTAVEAAKADAEDEGLKTAAEAAGKAAEDAKQKQKEAQQNVDNAKKKVEADTAIQKTADEGKKKGDADFKKDSDKVKEAEKKLKELTPAVGK
jgi:colicin import membrane protein